jgi:hypothetical protein
MLATWFFQETNARLSLNPIDLIIIVLYFVLVLGLGLYLRRFTTTGEEFFMAGREMTAWIAGLSFISANLGSLEMMGYAAATYQYGILVAHAYWIAAIPAILFLGLVMLPFYYICQTHSVPGYLKLRYGDGARSLSAISFAVMTILMSGINMYSMAIIMKVILGWNIHFSIWVSSLTVALYDLDWVSCYPCSRSDRNRRVDGNGPSHPDELSRSGFHSHVEHDRVVYRQSDGSALDRDRIWLGLGDLIRILDHGLPCGAARDGGKGSALGPTGHCNWCILQNDGAPYRHSARLAGTRSATLPPGSGKPGRTTERPHIQRSSSSDASPLLRTRTAWTGSDSAGCRLHVWDGR